MGPLALKVLLGGVSRWRNAPVRPLLVAQIRRQSVAAAVTAGDCKEEGSGAESSPPLISDALSKHLFAAGNEHLYAAEEGITVPPLLGKDLYEHFEKMAEEVAGKYRDLLVLFERVNALPLLPRDWSLKEGWTEYGAEGPKPVEAPTFDAAVLDTEVCLMDGVRPTFAVLATANAWYSWCSPRLVNATADSVSGAADTSVGACELIPLGQSAEPRVVIGHNVGFDRARVREQFCRDKSALRFWDTMALHVAVCGISSQQQAELRSTYYPSSKPWLREWQQRVSSNGLIKVHQFHCAEKAAALADECKTMKLPIKSDAAVYFKSGSLLNIRNSFQSLMSICAMDVRMTFDAFKVLNSKFSRYCPSKTTFAGMLEMGTSYLPVNNHWVDFQDEANKACSAQAKDLLDNLHSLAVKRVEQLSCPVAGNENAFKWQSDAWMWAEDWDEVKWKSRAQIRLDDAAELQQRAQPKVKGEKCVNTKVQVAADMKPKWFSTLHKSRLISEAASDGERLKMASTVLPSLLRLVWHGYPLFNSPKAGWGALVPVKKPSEHTYRILLPGQPCRVSFPAKVLYDKFGRCEEQLKERRVDNWLNVQNGAEDDDSKTLYKIMDEFRFYKLPHGTGPLKNVGNPFGMHFLADLENKYLRSDDEDCAEMVKQLAVVARDTSYWRKYLKRIHEQIVVFEQPETERKVGAIVPQLCVAGTVTRRATERLWLTASNPKKDRVGSEMKAMVQAPEGYRLVGADVDSQEQWIAALLGDARAGTRSAGAAPFSRMLLCGDKDAGTDLHSHVAKLLGVDRDQAKMRQIDPAKHYEYFSMTVANFDLLVEKISPFMRPSKDIADIVESNNHNEWKKNDALQVLNYSRLYGSGARHATELLASYLPNADDAQVTGMVNKLFATTKGVSVNWQRMPMVMQHHLREICFADPEIMAPLVGMEFMVDAEGRYWVPIKKDARQEFLWRLAQFAPGNDQIKLMLLDIGGIEPNAPAETVYEGLASQFKRLQRTSFKRRTFYGGTESLVFGCLQDIADAEQPVTPVLKCRLSDALTMPSGMTGRDSFYRSCTTSRVNWVVQSSGVDFLHCLLTCMHWLCTQYHISARFSISIHDEIRYLVTEGDADRCALALQLSNLFTRALFSQRVGIDQLPKSVAFFNKVDIDTVLRKEVYLDCVTPSNKDGLREKYGIACGEALSLDILASRCSELLLPLDS